MWERMQRNYMESVIQALQEVRSLLISHTHCAPDSMHLQAFDQSQRNNVGKLCSSSTRITRFRHADSG